MQKSVRQVVLECIFDLGVTVIYAAIAGLTIVAIVASDDGPVSIWTSVLYASLLPGAVIVLVGIDMGIRVLAERRPARKANDAVDGRHRFGLPSSKTCLSDR